MDVTHRYREPADDVRPRVDVTYRVRYRVDGGAWQTIGQTLSGIRTGRRPRRPRGRTRPHQALTT